MTIHRVTRTRPAPPSTDGTATAQATAATDRPNCQHEYRTDTFFSGFKGRQVKNSCMKCGQTSDFPGPKGALGHTCTVFTRKTRDSVECVDCGNEVRIETADLPQASNFSASAKPSGCVYVVIDEEDAVDFVCSTEEGAEAYITHHGMDPGNWRVACWEVWDFAVLPEASVTMVKDGDAQCRYCGLLADEEEQRHLTTCRFFRDSKAGLG